MHRHHRPTLAGQRWRMSALRTAAFSIAGLSVLGAVAFAAAGIGGSGQPPDDRAGDRAARATTRIKRETLVQRVEVKAELGYGEAVSLPVKAAGTVTWLAPTGETVGRGQIVLRVDDQPVVLLIGTMPAFRPLAKDTKGRDVEQFEHNLRQLGFTGFTVDETYSAETEAAVKRWQRRLGVTETGTIDPAQVVFAAAPIRIAEHLVRPGAAATGEMLSYTGVNRMVTAAVKVAESGWAKPGTAVTVVLPDAKEVAGVVKAVGRSASIDDSQAGAGQRSSGGTEGATVQVTVAINDQQALNAFDNAPVAVRYVLQQRSDVLTVPTVALLALAEGGYGLEVQDGAGWRIVPVEAGFFADGRVEVRGAGIDAGMTIRTPE
ncbi:peptidoglycan-binding protein [Phytohabitans rumicis]|uniref:Peptidoglycan-binding protein n=1 Tax=Phytohabitans rumicis TaxID=1076125 RepID=A0A6V8KQK2_9ACTN|nr:peptidoglycan-binding protein [Phytohabitans rumicis]GFJ87462.1 peptidoglycan-binding protein [Phytohabitans rumicis]